MTIRLHAYSNHPLCLFFTSKHPARIPTGTDNSIQRERKAKRCLKAQRIWEEKGYYLAVGWAVWRRSYLNRNAIAASSGPGLSESVETAQGCAESYLKEWYGARDRDVGIDDGCKDRAQCFCQLNRFVCSFIAHLPGFLPRSITPVRFCLSLKICFSSRFYFSLLWMFPHDFCFYSAMIQFLKLALSSSTFAVIANELCLLCWTYFFMTEGPLLAESCLRQPFVVAARWRLVFSFPPTPKEKTVYRCRFYPRAFIACLLSCLFRRGWWGNKIHVN